MPKLDPVTVTLSPGLDAWVRAAVASGLYGSARELVEDAVSVLRGNAMAADKAIADLRAAIDIGLADAEAGRTAPFVADRIKEAGRRGLRANSD